VGALKEKEDNVAFWHSRTHIPLAPSRPTRPSNTPPCASDRRTALPAKITVASPPAPPSHPNHPTESWTESKRDAKQVRPVLAPHTNVSRSPPGSRHPEKMKDVVLCIVEPTTSRGSPIVGPRGRARRETKKKWKWRRGGGEVGKREARWWRRAWKSLGVPQALAGPQSQGANKRVKVSPSQESGGTHCDEACLP